MPLHLLDLVSASCSCLLVDHLASLTSRASITPMTLQMGHHRVALGASSVSSGFWNGAWSHSLNQCRLHLDFPQTDGAVSVILEASHRPQGASCSADWKKSGMIPGS